MDYNNIYMPCWYCPYGHSCKYYQDALWDQWILHSKTCPACMYQFSDIYKANEDEWLKSITSEKPSSKRRRF